MPQFPLSCQETRQPNILGTTFRRLTELGGATVSYYFTVALRRQRSVTSSKCNHVRQYIKCEYIYIVIDSWIGRPIN